MVGNPWPSPTCRHHSAPDALSCVRRGVVALADGRSGAWGPCVRRLDAAGTMKTPLVYDIAVPTLSHDGSMVLLYMVCHGSHQYTPFMLAYIPAPWIRHGYTSRYIKICKICELKIAIEHSHFLFVRMNMAMVLLPMSVYRYPDGMHVRPWLSLWWWLTVCYWSHCHSSSSL